MLTSTLFFWPHSSLHNRVSVSLAPGTQWSHTPSVSLPAAEEWRTNGALSCPAAAKAVVLRSLRRERAADAMFSSLQRPLLRYGPFAMDRTPSLLLVQRPPRLE